MRDQTPSDDEIRRVLGVPPEDLDDAQLEVLHTIAAGMQWKRSFDIMARGLAEAVKADLDYWPAESAPSDKSVQVLAFQAPLLLTFEGD